MEKEKIKQMVKICQLYYQEGYNQQELAKKFRISRPQISRIISSAKEEGIVEININNPFSNESNIEKQLMQKFGLNDAVIVETTNMSIDQSIASFSKAGAFYLENVLRKGNVVGVMAGKSIQEVVLRTRSNGEKNVLVIPLVGGLGVQGANWHANSNVIQLAESMNYEYYVLNAPAIVSSLEMKSQLIQEEAINKVLERYEDLQTAIVGIGETTEEATFFKTMNLSREKLQEIKDAGAVCSIGTIFINAQGEEVAKSISDRMIGISGEKLKQTPLVIGIAVGVEKVEAITAALSGKWIDVLITDVQTGEQLI
ncbi:sugar-binding transcriptional regulator [Pseudogracilibacillus sp. SE30717A]|uniref:sugar-binding transcriptional regulator n=1 Tax=Pseudogracilibacillus sp. SE30717A TaxID=3098293 RepID=UPI00300DBECF